MYRSCMVLGILLAAWSGCGDSEKNPADSGAVVEFADANLEGVVREHLEKSAGALSRGELLAVTHLNARGREIADLSGIEQLANLELLELADNQIRDIAALAGMARLCTLDLANNQVESLRPLSELSQLRDLDLGNNAVRDIGPLFGLGALQRVELSGNPLDENSLNTLLEALREKGIEIAFHHELDDGSVDDREPDDGSIYDFKIAYVARSPGAEQKNDIYRLGITGTQAGDPVNLTRDPGSYFFPSWSPDGQKIVFVQSESEKQSYGPIYIMDADGRQRVQLTEELGRYIYFKWSPDGRRIAFQKYHGGDWDICVMDADGSNLDNLTDHPERDESPMWSPDGTRILFSSNRNGNSDIYAMDVDGSNLVNLTDHPGIDGLPRWSPDGTRIAFSSNRNDIYDIYVMDADSSNLVSLTDGSAPVITPVWSPDGKYIAYIRAEPDRTESIYIMDADGTHPTKVKGLDFSNWKFDPVWSPDGTHILFLSFSDRFNLHLVRVDGILSGLEEDAIHLIPDQEGIFDQESLRWFSVVSW